MAKTLPLIVYPVKDVAAATKFYSAFLDTAPYAESPYYVGYRLDNGQEIGLDPNASSVVSYIDVEDIEAELQRLTEAGADVAQPVKTVAEGLQIAQVSVDGNLLGLRHQA